MRRGDERTVGLVVANKQRELRAAMACSLGWLLCVASLSLSLTLLEPRLIRYEGIGISERADSHLHPVLCCAVLCCAVTALCESASINNLDWNPARLSSVLL